MRSAEALLLDDQQLSPVHTSQHVDFLSHEFEGVQLVRTARSIRHLSDPSNPESVGIRLKHHGRKGRLRKRKQTDTGTRENIENRPISSNGSTTSVPLTLGGGNGIDPIVDSDSGSDNDSEDLDDDPTRPDTCHRVVQTHETRKVRLQNILWRLWAVKTLSLPGTDPRDLNWDKSADATSLYGPLPILPPPIWIDPPISSSDSSSSRKSFADCDPLINVVGAVPTFSSRNTPTVTRPRTSSFNSRSFGAFSPNSFSYSVHSLSAFSDQYSGVTPPQRVRGVLRVRPPQNALDVAAELDKLDALNEEYCLFHEGTNNLRFGGGPKTVRSQETISDEMDDGECQCAECVGDITLNMYDTAFNEAPILPYPLSVQDRVRVALGIKSLEVVLTEMAAIEAAALAKEDLERDRLGLSDTEDSTSDFGLTMSNLTPLRLPRGGVTQDGTSANPKAKTRRKRRVEFEKKVEQAVIVYPDEESILEEEDEDEDTTAFLSSSPLRTYYSPDGESIPKSSSRQDVSDFFDKDYIGSYRRPPMPVYRLPHGQRHWGPGQYGFNHVHVGHHQRHRKSGHSVRRIPSTDELYETASSSSTIGRNPSLDGLSDSPSVNSLKKFGRSGRVPRFSSGSSLTFVGSNSGRTASTVSMSSTGTASSLGDSESASSTRRRRRKPAGFRRIESGDLAEPGVSVPQSHMGGKRRNPRRTDADPTSNGRKDEEEEDTSGSKSYIGYVADVAGQRVGTALAYVGVDQGTIARGREVLDNVREMAGWLGVVAGFAGWI
ncbi:hypothetical protein HDU93_003110 [Gonapodya sp. JEL0774]|nr:hypothetical protein HDU93_003110 [Gonapodya sp. JEL0774]